MKPAYVYKPVTTGDLPEIYNIASGLVGMTSLPANIGLLGAKIEQVEATFAGRINDPAAQMYWIKSKVEGEGLGGISGLYPQGPWWPSLEITDGHLCACDPLTGQVELGTNVLAERFRGVSKDSPIAGIGSGGSRVRFLLLANIIEHRANNGLAPLGSKIFAEFRAAQDSNGSYPVAEELAAIAGTTFEDLEGRTSQFGHRAVMEPLLDRYKCIPISQLSPEAQALLRIAHPGSQPAQKILSKEGIVFDNLIGNVDGGLQAVGHVNATSSVSQSRVMQVAGYLTVNGHAPPGLRLSLIANTHIGCEFLAAHVPVDASGDGLYLTKEGAEAIGAGIGDYVRVGPEAFEKQELSV